MELKVEQLEESVEAVSSQKRILETELTCVIDPLIISKSFFVSIGKPV